MQRRNLDQIAAGVLVAFSLLVYFVLIPTQIPPDRLGLSSSFFPKFSVIIIGGLGVVLFIKARMTRSVAEQKTIFRMTGEEAVRAAVIFCLMVVYVVLLDFIGFFIATPLMLGAMLYYCGLRNPMVLWPIVVLLPSAIFVIFELVMKLMLPRVFFG